MKKMKVLILVVSYLLINGCVVKGNPVSNEEKGDFKLEFLFQKDGCKMYRFKDGSRYIYWCNCSGSILNNYNSGKQSLKNECLITK